ncbi:hypothetical protein D3870_01610 [Noviherbaspirillum cavernae]|uniref:Uncharacterized protein n=1 Tax=Noviherbaspirillum cavernae TaxID=2320862 RepID=A0A418WXP7_9BURK|nr:hypothetical protein [Noviherbaspirillum cavernae]RJG04893.1 hypothetical protein D3870_01610 [Noviherbaspirillum cavernae]
MIKQRLMRAACATGILATTFALAENAVGNVASRAVVAAGNRSEARAIVVQQRHFAAYRDYLLMQNAASGGSGASRASACIGRDEGEGIPALIAERATSVEPLLADAGNPACAVADRAN